MSVTYDYEWMKPLKKTRLDSVIDVLTNIGILLVGLTASLVFAVVVWWDRISLKRLFETMIGFGIIALGAVILITLSIKREISYHWNQVLENEWKGKNPFNLIILIVCVLGAIVACFFVAKLAFTR